MDGLKPLYGGLLKIPAPLELSGNWCAHACAYCFANLNAPTRTLDVKGVSRLLADYQNRNTIEGYLLRDGYPVIISNHPDGWTHRMIEYTNQEINSVDYVEIIRQ